MFIILHFRKDNSFQNLIFFNFQNNIYVKTLKFCESRNYKTKYQFIFLHI